MCSVLEVERKNARSEEKTDSSDQLTGGEEGRKLNAETLRAQRRTREEFTQRARRKSTEGTEMRKTGAQVGMAGTQAERNPRGWLKRPALH
jgi:hypothetical protein